VRSYFPQETYSFFFTTLLPENDLTPQGNKDAMFVTQSTRRKTHVGKLIFLKGDALGTICAVPEKIADGSLTVDLNEYLLMGWASINCGLNQNAIGSHLFPEIPSEPTLSEMAVRDTEKLRKIGRVAD
jgi:hypothetical protein